MCNNFYRFLLTINYSEILIKDLRQIISTKTKFKNAAKVTVLLAVFYVNYYLKFINQMLIFLDEKDKYRECDRISNKWS